MRSGDRAAARVGACGAKGSQHHQPGTQMGEREEKWATITQSRDGEEHKEREKESGQQRDLFGYPSVKEEISCRDFVALVPHSSGKLLSQQSRRRAGSRRRPLPLLNSKQTPCFQQGSRTAQLLISSFLFWCTSSHETFTKYIAAL